MSLSFVVLDSQNAWDDFLEELSDGRPSNRVLSSVLEYAHVHLGAAGAVVEDDYVDRDYRDEFTNVYAKCFRSYGDRCKRVHFFGRAIRRRSSIAAARADYLGFAVIKPVEFGLVGRTVLKPWKIENSDFVYPLCSGRFKTHLNGIELEISGAPFIEQDRMATTCAQASMWSALRYLSSTRLATPLRGPHEVSEYAAADSPFEERVVPAKGLSWWSMMLGFRKLGFNTTLEIRPRIAPPHGPDYLWDAGWDPMAFIYAAVESQMPAVIGFDGQREGHAMTVVGHIHSDQPVDLPLALARASRTSHKSGRPIVASHEWVSGFLVHDDQNGPYRILPTNDASRVLFEAGPNSDLLTPPQYGNVVDHVSTILAPVPGKLYLDSTAAEASALAYITQNLVRARLLQSFHDGTASAGEMLRAMQASHADPLVFRSYYTHSCDYKNSLQEEPLRSEMHSLVRTRYAETSMPTYIWVVELSTASRISGAVEEDRQILGEFILDSTANNFDYYPFIFCHMPGVLRQFDRVGALPAAPVIESVLDGDGPYRHISRRP